MRLRPLAWLWARRVYISAAVGTLMILSTVYVLWAIHDLPGPSQNVLATGDVVVLDRNGKVIEDWSPAGRYHVTLTLQEMGRYAPNAVLAAEDRHFYHVTTASPGAVPALAGMRLGWEQQLDKLEQALEGPSPSQGSIPKAVERDSGAY